VGKPVQFKFAGNLQRGFAALQITGNACGAPWPGKFGCASHVGLIVNLPDK
jgi:deoxyinosine 3'endonuclease (endonuclease V)